MAYHDSTLVTTARPIQPSVSPYLHKPYCLSISPNVTLYLVPEWLRAILNTTKRPISTVSDMAALSRLLSVHDRALLEAMLRYPLWGPHLPSFASLIDGQSSYTNAITANPNEKIADQYQIHYTEYAMTVCHLARTEAFVQEALDQLSLPPSDALVSIEDGGLYHRFELSAQGHVYLHIQRGIFNALQDRTYATRFVSDYLKVLYGFIPIFEVSKMSVFLDYVALL